MSSVFVTVYNKNLQQESEKGDNTNKGNAMFPTNVKYIFEDDEIINTNLISNDIINDENENVIIIDMEANGYVSDVHMISDNYQLLSYKTNTDYNNKKEDKEVLFGDLSLNVLSRFKHEKGIGERKDLDDLVNLYISQNEQLNVISNSF